MSDYTAVAWSVQLSPDTIEEVNLFYIDVFDRKTTEKKGNIKLSLDGKLTHEGIPLDGAALAFFEMVQAHAFNAYNAAFLARINAEKK